MSTTTATPPLFARLVDDAAVFPPGNVPLPTAVEEHLARRSTPYGDLVGPLLLPPSSAAELLDLAAGRPIDVVLVSRPGADTSVLQGGARLLRSTTATVVAVELGWMPLWREALDLAPVVSLEVPREEGLLAVADVAAAARVAAPGTVQLKFRTGGTPTWAWPDEDELAAFLTAAVGARVPAKLTGGLHHAVRADHGPGPGEDPQHGFLNVLLAVHAALQGEGYESVSAVLAQRDRAALVDSVKALTTADAAEVRSALASYGCCTVTDPVSELVSLGMLG